VFVKVGQYDPYLSLDAALQLLALEKSPNKAEAQVFLQQVVLGQPATLEGVAARVREGSLVKAPPSFCFQSKQLRTEIGDDGEPVFHVGDLCAILGHTNPSQAVAQHVDPCDLTKREVTSDSGKSRARKTQTVNFVREPGLWALILGSAAPNAKPVKRWVTADVLPSLRKTGRYEMSGALRTGAAPQSTLPDTSSREPLVFDFQDTRGHLLQVRVAIRNGRAECVALDLANALGEREPDFLKWYAAIPKLYHGSIPSPSGETALATLSAEGLAYLFGQRAHRPEVDAFRNFWFGAVEPALAARRAGAAASGKATSEAARAADPALAETVPAEATEWPEASDDTLRARFGELAAWLWRRDGGNAGAAFPNAAALLARLWRETDGVWLATGTRNGFARSLGMAHGKSAEQGLARLVAWGLVEVRPEGAAWPSEIRLNREKVLAALREAELAVFARENVHGEIRHRDA
jgi:prophage antirepressor-like protein